MATGKIVWNGRPGEVWTNDTDRFKYQLICDLVHTCGVCLQYHLAISNWWPIPFHRDCRCTNLPVKPGQSARPFESFRAILDGLDPAQQTEAIGRSNFQLLEAGKVKWEDIVTEGRVRDFKEVVAIRKLTVDEMVAAGVRADRAKAAYAAVHTPEQELIRQHRRELVGRLEHAGLSREQIREAAARDIHGRTGIGAGPSKSGTMPASKRPTKLPDSLRRGFVRFATAAAPPPEKPPVPTFDEAIRSALEGMSGETREGRKARRAAVAGVIESHASRPGTPIARHGMTHPEAFRTLRYRGLDFHFTGAAGPGTAIVLTVENLERRGIEIPGRLHGATRRVYFSGQANKADPYWRIKYNNPDHVSLATGGDGDVVVYNGAPLGLATLSHEMGHNLAGVIYGGEEPGGDYVRKAIRSAEPPVSEYAANSPAEDFAEAVRWYVDDRDKMRSDFPIRFGVIDKIMGDEEYGG